MRNKVNLKILQKIAQTATNQIATDEANKNNSIAGAPPSFVASSAYPTIVLGFGAKNVPWINGLSNTLNNSLYYSSNGQVNLMQMKNNNFSIGTSQIPSEDLKKIMNFCKVIYQNIYTDLGSNFVQPLTPIQISEKIKYINSNDALNSLPTVVSNSQLAAKLGGNLKTIIQNYLLQIK